MREHVDRKASQEWTASQEDRVIKETGATGVRRGSQGEMGGHQDLRGPQDHQDKSSSRMEIKRVLLESLGNRVSLVFPVVPDFLAQWDPKVTGEREERQGFLLRARKGNQG